MIQRLIILNITISIFNVQKGFTDSIWLKSGTHVEGKIIKEENGLILFDFEGVKLTIYNDEIESIQRDSTEEKAAVEVASQKREIVENIPQEKPQPKVEIIKPIKSSNEPLPKEILIPKEITVSKESNQFDKQIVLTKNNILKNNKELDSNLDTYLLLLDESTKKNDNRASMENILQIIKLVETAKNKLIQTDQDGSLDELKQAALNYYEHLIKYHSALLQKLAKNNSNYSDKNLDIIMNDLELSENKFNQLLEQNIQNTSTNVIKKAEPIINNSVDIQKARDEYYFLIKQVKELIGVNEALKKDTEDLIIQNKMLENDLKHMLEKNMQLMSNQQKRDLLQYLNSE